MHDMYAWHACMTYMHDMHAWHACVPCMHAMHAWHACMTCMHVMHACHACMSCMHACHACMPSNIWEGPEKSKKVEKSKRSETIWNHWKPSETIGNPSETFGKPQKPLETFGNLRKPLKMCWKNEVLERNGLNFGPPSSRPDRVNPLDRGTSKIKVLANFPLKIEGKLDFSRLWGRIPN